MPDTQTVTNMIRNTFNSPEPNAFINTLNIFNEVLSKSKLETSEGLKLAENLFKDPVFMQYQDVLQRLIWPFFYGKNFPEDLQFTAKVAEFISNQRYALLRSSHTTGKERLKQLVLNDQNEAIELLLKTGVFPIFSSEEDFNPPSPEVAEIIHTTLIPIIYTRAKILAENNDEKYKSDLLWITYLDTICLSILNKPTAISISIIETILRNETLSPEKPHQILFSNLTKLKQDPHEEVKDNKASLLRLK